MFREALIEDPEMYYAFEILYWTGIREGELLALTKSDFDLVNNKVSISKSYQRIDKKDFITDPKTEKSNRIIDIPEFLSEEVEDYICSIYKLKDNQRLFEVTKHKLHDAMQKGSEKSGVKRIRIHDLRHSHVALLIELGYSPVAIAERMGHESIDITLNYAHLYPSKQIDMASKLDEIGKRE